MNLLRRRTIVLRALPRLWLWRMRIPQTSMRTSPSIFLKIHVRISCIQSPSPLEPHALTRITTTILPSLEECLEGRLRLHMFIVSIVNFMDALWH
jgi:hypothetical protein